MAETDDFNALQNYISENLTINLEMSQSPEEKEK